LIWNTNSAARVCYLKDAKTRERRKRKSPQTWSSGARVKSSFLDPGSKSSESEDLKGKDRDSSRKKKKGQKIERARENTRVLWRVESR